MSEALPLVLSLCAFVFSFLALLCAATAAVIVIGWKNSTHKVVQLPADPFTETRTEWDLPREVLDKLPSAPETPTPEEYVRAAKRVEADIEDQYSQDW